jgi:hypothetical protein
MVSKSCCPLCWESLTILGVNSEAFRVRCGRHLNLYFAKPPKWLPVDVLKKLLEQIRELAAVELCAMVWKYGQISPATKRHGHTPSQETNSNISIASVTISWTRAMRLSPLQRRTNLTQRQFMNSACCLADFSQCSDARRQGPHSSP